MISEDEIRHLADLAKMELSDEDIKNFRERLGPVLEYVSSVQEIADANPYTGDPDHINVMREDADPHTGGEFTKDLMSNVPDKKDGYVRVKKVLSQGR